MLAGALVALTIGWPLAGSVQALSWPAIVFDADGPDKIAADRIVAAHPEWTRWALGGRPNAPAPFLGQDCLQTLTAEWTKRPGDADLSSVLRHSRGERDSAMVVQISEQTLLDLPRPSLGHPVLGALAGCIDGSLLSVVCDRWASQRIVNALKIHRDELIAGFTANADRAQQMACRALDGEISSGKSLGSRR